MTPISKKIIIIIKYVSSYNFFLIILRITIVTLKFYSKSLREKIIGFSAKLSPSLFLFIVLFIYLLFESINHQLGFKFYSNSKSNTSLMPVAHYRVKIPKHIKTLKKNTQKCYKIHTIFFHSQKF